MNDDNGGVLLESIKANREGVKAMVTEVEAGFGRKGTRDQPGL